MSVALVSNLWLARDRLRDSRFPVDAHRALSRLRLSCLGFFLLLAPHAQFRRRIRQQPLRPDLFFAFETDPPLPGPDPFHGSIDLPEPSSDHFRRQRRLLPLSDCLDIIHGLGISLDLQRV